MSIKDLFNDEIAIKRSKDVDRLLKAHEMPNDREMAVALFIEGIRRIMPHYGPFAMGTFAKFFVEVWRAVEIQVVQEIALSGLTDELFKTIKENGEEDEKKKQPKPH